jgi:thiol-disulfide isomerase/thioredoxin
MLMQKMPSITIKQRKRSKSFWISFLFVLILVGVPAAGKPAYAGNDQTEKPILEIFYYYDNPCSSCPTISDFEDLVRKSAKEWTDKIAIRVFSYPAYTTDGMAKIKFLLDEHQVPKNERYYTDVVLIGNRLLLTNIEAELPAVLAVEAEFLLANAVAPTDPARPTPTWQPTGTERYSADLIFFSSESCENCKKAEVLLAEIEEKTDLAIIRYDVVRDAARFREIIDQFQIAAPAVPLLIYQDKVWIGYNPVIVREIRAAAGLEGSSDERRFLFWNIDEVPLVFSTAIIGLTDGFNPCSLWALMFLISMIIRFQSRKTMLAVGLTYIFVVTIIYGLFILGLFGIVTHIIDITWLRILLFALAFLFGAANVYSFFSRNDPFVSISEENKKRFVQQIRTRLYAQTRLPALLAATALIALLASLIELPCTAGFPVIWNAILAEHGAGPAVYFPLLGLYLLMYILDEIIVVLLMTVTMKKLFVNQTIGRSLKLVSGLLMVYLALMLLLGVDYFNSTTWVVGGSAAVVIIAAALAFVLKQRRPGS